MTWAGIVLVAVGSGTGALSRYAIGQGLAKINNSEFPWATWIVNMLGTFLLGLFFQEFSVLHHEPAWWLLLGTGFCGAFTTFSTMSVEVMQLLQRRAILAILYLGSSVALGFLLAWIPQWWV